MSKQTFIDSIKDGAIEGWEKFKILPSITIAQAILESNWGKSNLAVKANNIFGIKGDYNGRKYLHDTWEVDKEGKRFNSTERFRHYPNIGASVVDHGDFFTSTPWRSNNYKHVIGETNYKIAAQALSDAGYATDPQYADKLINIIETYNLNQWDKKKGEGIKMAKSIIIDPGHGGTDPGAIGFGVREKDWNLRISLYQYERLKELGANVAITRTNDKSLDSVARTNLIKNKYDIAISNHWNAFNGSARGVETIYSIHGGKQFATNLANAIVKASGLPLRRVFSRRLSSGKDYYFMHRLTGTTRTIIIEYGFIDNVHDHNWYKNESNFYKVAEAVIEAICKEIGITYKAKGNVAKPSVPSGKSNPVPKPVAKPKPQTTNKLAVDGYWGPATTRALQRHYGTTVDGKITGQPNNRSIRNIPSATTSSTGSLLIKAMQKDLGTTQDGKISAPSLMIRALQKRLGTPQDGIVSKPSLMVKEMQRRLNNGTF